MSYDHNDIYNIVERLAILEGRITPTTVKKGLNPQQKSVPQLPALFKPKHISVLKSKTDPEHPMHGYMVGSSESAQDDREPVEEAVATEDVLEKVKKSFADYLSNVADEIKQDTDLKDKKKEDSDLKKKDKRDRDLIAKEDQTTIVPTTGSSPGDETGLQPEIVPELEESVGKLEVGDRIAVIGPNEYEGEFGEVLEFAPSRKFVIIKLDNGEEASMHISDVEFHDDQEDVEDWEDDQEDLPSDYAYRRGESPYDQSEPQTESAPIKSVTNECGLWEIHGNEPRGFEIHREGRCMPTKFKSIEEAEMALEMFAARRKLKDESADYIEEA